MREAEIHIGIALLAMILLLPISARADDPDGDILLLVNAALTGGYNPDRHILLNISPFGPGSVTGSAGGVGFNSATQSGRTGTWLNRDMDGIVEFTAVPDQGAHIEEWEGCDSVSEDLTRCIVHTGADRYVTVAFDNDVPDQGGTVLDISTADLDLAGNTLFVAIDPQNTWLIQAMSQMQAGDFIVATTNGSLLKQVLSVTAVNGLNYQLETREASLEEVVTSGAAGFTKQLTHADLAGQDGNLVAPDGSVVGRIRPSADPSCTVFTIDLVEGTPAGANRDLGFKHAVTLWEQGSASVKMVGSVDMQFTVDFNVDIRWNWLRSTVQGVRVVPEVRAKESIALKVAGEVEGKFKKQLGTIHFQDMWFFVGVVPVVLAPQVQFELKAELGAGAEVEAGVEFTQKLRAGMEYRNGGNPAFSWPHSADISTKFTPPDSIELAAEAKGFLNTAPLLKLYNVTGPGLDIGPYLSLIAESTAGPTFDGVTIKAWLGFLAAFKWDLSGDTKIGQLVGADKLEQKSRFTLLNEKYLLKKWTIGAKTRDAVGAPQPGLTVSGGDYWATQRQGESVTHEQAYTLANAGDREIAWSLELPDGSPAVPTATAGALPPGGSESVRVTVDGASLSRGYHLVPLVFRAGDDIETREIEIDVTAAGLASPALDAPTLVDDNTARLAWTYADAATLGDVGGFYVQASTDGGSFADLQTLANPPLTDGAYSTVVNDLAPGAEHRFRVVAFGDKGELSEPSEPRTLSVPPVANPAPESSVAGVDFPHVQGSDLGLVISCSDASGLGSLWLGVYNDAGGLVFEWHADDPQDINGVFTDNPVVPAAALPVGAYTYALRAIDDTGRGSVVTGRYAVVGENGPSIALLAPSQEATLQLGRQVEVAWTSSGLDASEIVIDLRSASSTLRMPDGMLWHRFTHSGADTGNDGSETITLPTSLNTAYDDWVFCVGPSDDPALFDCSDAAFRLVR